MSSFLELLILFILILINGVFAMAELAIVSARKIRLQQRMEDGDQKAALALKLVEEPSRFLSTVQIWITLVGILSGAFGGATIAEQIATLLQGVPWLAPYGEALGVAVVVVVISYFTLVLGELVPKRLAMQDADGIAIRLAGPMEFVARIASPLVRILSTSTEFFVSVLGIRGEEKPQVTEEDIKSMLALGTQTGVFQEAEQQMVTGVFRLADWDVRNLITPRRDIIWLNLDDPLEEAIAKIVESGHTQFPAARGSLDNVVGIVQSRDLLVAQLTRQPLDFERLMVEPIIVPESTPVLKILEQFQASHLKIAMVIDEFGGLLGMVTINDILQAILGNRQVSNQAAGASIVTREDGTWLVDGMLSVDELKEFLDLDELPDEKSADYQTLGGFVMTSLGRVPSPSDHFTYDRYTFEVVDMDGFRVDKVLVKSSGEPSASQAE